MKQQWIILLLSLTCAAAWAQRPVEVITQIALPFPNEFDELLEDYTSYTFTVINYTHSDQEIYFLADLIGDNGISAITRRDYQPPMPFVLPARQSIMLTGTDLEEMNVGITTDDVIVDGLSPVHLAQGVIPEGNYQLCINAFDFATGEQLSSGCSFPFSVGNGDVPRIITPFEEEIIPSAEIPTFLISWEPPGSFPGSSSEYIYILKMVDLTQYSDLDLEEVFLDGGVAVQFEREVMSTNYFYNAEGDDPPMIYGHQYAIRVQVIDPMNAVEFENGGYSEIRTFWYGDQGDPFQNENEPDSTLQQQELPADCYSRCDIPFPENETPVTDLSLISTLKIGHFYIEQFQLTPSGNVFNGEGIIVLNFLNDLNVRVTLHQIQFNTDGHIFTGEVRGVPEPAEGLGDVMQYFNFGAVETGVSMADSYIPPEISAQIGTYLMQSRMIAALAGSGEVGLPIGFSQAIAGNEFTLGITDLLLTPSAAKAKLVVGTKLALFEGDNWLMFVADSLCIHPAGFGGEYAVSLGADLVLNNDNENAFELIFKGNTSGSSNAPCQMVMNCDGLQEVSLSGELHFARNVIVPELEDGTVGEEKAKAYFQLSFQQVMADSASMDTSGFGVGMHWLASLTMDRFQIPRLRGWTFEVQSAHWDMSELENPADIQFPAEYSNTDLDFTGVWIEQAMIFPPEKLCASERTSVTVSNLLIDPDLYCQIEAVDILQMGEGNVGGWALSVDAFHLDIYQNQLLEASMEGELHIPLLDTSSSILYTGLIGQGESEEDEPGESSEDYTYHFSTTFSEDVKFNFLIAEGTIASDSYLDLQFHPGDDETSYAHVVLHGELSVNTDQFYPENLPELPANISFPEMEYSFDFHSVDGFNSDQTFIAFASPQKLISGFPINLDDFDVGISMTDQSEVSVDFDVLISLSENETDLAASVHFSFISNLTTMSMLEDLSGMQDMQDAARTITSIRLTRVEFDSITLDVEISKFSMQGAIVFYNDPLPDGGRNKGIRGDISVTLPIDGITGQLTAVFGNIGIPAATFSENYYPYWYVSGQITFPAGIPLGSTGVGLYGLGGGIGKNMVQTQLPVSLAGQITGEPVFTPTYQSFRLEFAAIFGTVPRPDAFNADIRFIAQFVNGGLDMIGIEGDGYIMTPMNQRSDPQIYVGMDVYMYLGNASRDFSIDGNLLVAVNVANGVLRGNMDEPVVPNQLVQATFHISPSSFFFYAGQPDFNVYDEDDPRGSALLTIEGILQANLKTYMMVGHGIPTSLPPLPRPIQQILDNPEGALGGTSDATAAQGQTGGVDFESGAGFAHGSYVEVTADIDALLLYATLAVYLGYDMNITQRTTNCANTGDRIGINGWYAEGQAYAGLTGGMGLQIKLFGEQRKFELFQLAAAIALAGGGPNPFYFTGRASVAYQVLGGKIRGTSSFSMMVGERCTPLSNDPLAGINFYEIVEPEQGEQDVFVGTALHAKFALPMSEIITIPQPVEDENGVITHSINLRYRPEVTYQLRKVNGNVPIPLQSPMWTDDREHGEFYMLAAQALEPNRQYDFSMSIKAWDYQLNQWLRVSGTTWTQDTVVRFKTGDMPPDLYNWVTHTVPLPMERYFLQDEQARGKVYFSTSIDQDFYFPETGQTPGSFRPPFTYEYFIRFTHLENQTESEIPFTYFQYGSQQEYGLDFVLPDLDHEAIYALQVIRKSPLSANFGRRGGQQEIQIASLQQNNLSTNLTLVNAASVPPGEILSEGEFLLYHTYFRTSQFNLLREKLQAATSSPSAYGNANPAHYGKKLEVNLTLAEPFETRDFQTFHPGSPAYQFMEFMPRVRALDLFQKPYHNQHAEPRLQDFRNEYINSIRNGVFFFPWPDEEMKLDWGSSTLYRLPANNFQANLKSPLTIEEVSGLWASYTGSGQYFNSTIPILGVATMDIHGSDFVMLNPNDSKIIYDTHHKVSRDRKTVLDWSATYLASFSPYYMTTFQTAFANHEPGFLTMVNQLNNSNLKLQEHPGSYDIRFSRNVATKPGEEMFNIFTMYTLPFSTPLSFSGAGGHQSGFSGGFHNFSTN